MPSSQHITRLLVFVDGTWYTPDGSRGLNGDFKGNTSNVYRMFASTKEGHIDEGNGRIVTQKRRYYHGIGSTESQSVIRKLQEGVYGEGCKDMIKEVYQDACKELTSPDDELWLYGFSRGAYVVRAVAGLFHHIHAIAATDLEDFNIAYSESLRLLPSIQGADRRRGGAIHYQLTASQTRLAPKIRFVGTFDTVKSVAHNSLYDISLVDSIENFRHAVALNERRQAFSPELIFPDKKQIDCNERTAVQAWFLGTHADMGAGNNQDGLSLYPLQWMLVESRNQGLHLEFRKLLRNSQIIDNPLKIVFPDNEKVWNCKMQNGMVVEMYDLRMIHTSRDFALSYNVHINWPSRPMPTKPREPFENETLRGYVDDACQGTIIHPSVYLVLDTYSHVCFNGKDLECRAEIESFRDSAIPEGNEIFWDQAPLVINDKVEAARILVCGNTGVGKSTLINRVFGVPLTEESDYRQGQHDINHAFDSPNHPRILIHDSCGFAAGDTAGVRKLKKFLQARSGKAKPEDRLHAIWFCIDTDASRIRDAATEETFRLASKYALLVPIIVIGTKADKFLIQMKGVSEKAVQFEKRKALIESELGCIPYSRFDAAVYVSKDDHESIGSLVTTTLGFFDDEQIRRHYIAAQVVRLDVKINLAISLSMDYYKHAVRWAAVPLPGVGLTTDVTVSFLICHAVIQAFGCPELDPKIVLGILKNTSWSGWDRNAAMLVSETMSVISSVLTAAAFSAPVGAAIALLQVPVTVGAISGAILTCICDIILILESALVNGHQWIGRQDIEDAAKRFQQGEMVAVHRQVHDLSRKTTALWTAFQYPRIQIGIERIINLHREHKENSDVSVLAPAQSTESELEKKDEELPLQASVNSMPNLEYDKAEGPRPDVIENRISEISENESKVSKTQSAPEARRVTKLRKMLPWGTKKM